MKFIKKLKLAVKAKNIKKQNKRNVKRLKKTEMN